MDQGLAARIIAAVVVIASFAIGASQGNLIEMGVGVGAAIIASVGFWFMPPTDNDITKLRDHLLLSVPIALLAVVSGSVNLVVDGVFQLPPFMALILALFVPASMLEAKLGAKE